MTSAPRASVASTIRSACPPRAGGVVSRTITSKDEVAVLPAASLAEQVTSVEPRAKVVPGIGEQSTLTAPSTRSEAAGSAYPTTAPLGPVASTTSFACGTIAGGVVSCTTTLKVEVAVFPAASVAEQVTSVVPRTKAVPDSG